MDFSHQNYQDESNNLDLFCVGFLSIPKKLLSELEEMGISVDGREVERHKPFLPELGLYEGMLERALRDLNLDDPLYRYDKKDAIRWILSDSTETLSFFWTCDLLDITYETRMKCENLARTTEAILEQASKDDDENEWTQSDEW